MTERTVPDAAARDEAGTPDWLAGLERVSAVICWDCQSVAYTGSFWALEKCDKCGARTHALPLVFRPTAASRDPSAEMRERPVETDRTTRDRLAVIMDLEREVGKCCDTDDGDAVCHRCGVMWNAADLLRAELRERPVEDAAPRNWRKDEGVECEWIGDGDGNYDTGCGGMFIVLEGTPEQNRMRFCPYCGARLLDMLSQGRTDA